MSDTAKPTPHLTPFAANLPATVPFVGPEALERSTGTPFAARLGANENVFGPSPKAITAMQEAAQEVWMYGDPESHDLRTALAAKHAVPAKNIVVGAGIDGLLDSIVRLTITQGDHVVTSAGAYPTFNYHVTGYGGTIHAVRYTVNFEDPDHLIAKARDVGAKLIYISNADNPMGTCHSAQTIKQMIKDLPENCLLVLDEAYVELAPANTAPAFDVSNPQVIRTRTFSKSYGMAGARIGYAIGHEDFISAFDRVRNHFGISRIAQAGAVAALADDDYHDAVRAKIEASRQALYQIAQDNGLMALASATNFVAINCGEDGDFARGVVDHLAAQGIFVRMPSIAPLDRFIRVSCGTPNDMERVAAALPKALAAVRTR